jgi:hypothetical protein
VPEQLRSIGVPVPMESSDPFAWVLFLSVAALIAGVWLLLSKDN